MKQKLIITIWFLGFGSIISMMHSWHMVEFQAPNLELTQDYLNQSQELEMTHFLAADCSCSKHLLDYFLQRKPHQKVKEKIVLIGDAPKYESKIITAGFELEKITIEEAMSTDAFLAVPLLIIHSKESIVYTGGYTEGAITPLSKFYDLIALEAIQENKNIAALPIKGCAVAQTFQKSLDPIGLKYRGPTNE